MRLVIAQDSEDMTNWAANYVAKSINDFKDKTVPFVLGVSTGKSLAGIYKVFY